MNDLSRKNCEYGIVRRDVSGGAGVRLHARYRREPDQSEDELHQRRSQRQHDRRQCHQ